jgi:hypothetical protein
MNQSRADDPATDATDVGVGVVAAAAPPSSTTDDGTRFWSRLRYFVWQALAADDPIALEVALCKACKHRRIPIDELLRLLRDRLWRPVNADPAGTYRRGLLAAAAGSRRGVPVAGAVRCVRHILRFPHTAADIDEAIALCSRDAAARGPVIAALRYARSGTVPRPRIWRLWSTASRTPHGLADALRG